MARLRKSTLDLMDKAEERVGLIAGENGYATAKTVAYELKFSEKKTAHVLLLLWKKNRVERKRIENSREYAYTPASRIKAIKPVNANPSLTEPLLIIQLDFSDYPDVLAFWTEEAKNQVRTVEQQLIHEAKELSEAMEVARKIHIKREESNDD
jgi:hypothetical protein